MRPPRSRENGARGSNNAVAGASPGWMAAADCENNRDAGRGYRRAAGNDRSMPLVFSEFGVASSEETGSRTPAAHRASRGAAGHDSSPAGVPEWRTQQG